jgi:hypothetical protein
MPALISRTAAEGGTPPIRIAGTDTTPEDGPGKPLRHGRLNGPDGQPGGARLLTEGEDVASDDGATVTAIAGLRHALLPDGQAAMCGMSGRIPGAVVNGTTGAQPIVPDVAIPADCGFGAPRIGNSDPTAAAAFAATRARSVTWDGLRPLGAVSL